MRCIPTEQPWNMTAMPRDALRLSGKNIGTAPQWMFQVVTNSEYHTTGNLIGVLKGETDANGQCTQYFYNTNNGRLEAVIYPNETGAPIGMKIYRYGQAEGVFDEYFFEKTEKEQVDRFDQPVLFCSPIL